MQSGPLSGLSFAVKDVFDIKGNTSGAGNPDWLRTHPPAESTAPALLALLQRGAALEGTTQTDELMYSLNGENAHYGTPINPVAPDRIPGGSSSGSAVAAAAGLVDFAIGTDTGGSIRIPSSYCGLYGFRPTHGAVSTEGLIPLAHSFDTVGWMSRDVNILLKTGCVLLKKTSQLLKTQQHFRPISETMYSTRLTLIFHLSPTIISRQKRGTCQKQQTAPFYFRDCSSFRVGSRITQLQYS